MDLQLNRIDYTHVATTGPRTTRLLPCAPNSNLQKVVVGDQEGTIQLFTLQKNNPQIVFKTLPGKPITAVKLGGALNTDKDRIFASAGNSVIGYTRKGKQFLGLETNLTDDIRSIHVSGSDLLICSSFVYNRFSDCKEVNYYLSGDDIAEVTCLPAERTNALVAVLACGDRSLRLMKENGVRYSVETDGVPDPMELLYGDGGSTGEHLLYGTTDGAVACVQMGRNAATERWTLRLEGGAGVVCMDHMDVTGDGVDDLVLGRDDGTVQLLSYDAGEHAAPTLRYSYTGTDTITSVQGGFVSNPEHQEILVTSYSGWLYGLSSEKSDQHSHHLHPGLVPLSADAKQRISKLRAEVEELQQTVTKERERYRQATQSTMPGVSAVPFFPVNDKMILSGEDASYQLWIEVPTPIDNVMLQSDVPIDLLDVEKNSAVVSFSSCDHTAGNFLLATYRCQSNTARLEVKVRTIEGQHGTLKAYITPRALPKCCQVRQYTIKPLSLHLRTHRFDPDRPYSCLILTGRFSFAEVHSWIVLCLPEVPERRPVEQPVSLNFKSTFIDTMLNVEYSGGRVQFKSDNISTISILKDVLTKEATKKAIHLNISCDVNDQSVVHTLQLLDPLLSRQLQLARQVALIGPLSELVAHERDADSADFLTPEYRDILQRAPQLQAQHKQQPAQLERLYGMITDLYIDKHKFQGINMKSKVPQLLDILYNYDLNNLLEFFCRG